MERGKAPFTMDRNGYHVSWDAISAWVCTQCGEAYFEAGEVDVIRQALADLDRQTAILAAADC
jgi:YgiT-type zinc finger domain-containing protein